MANKKTIIGTPGDDSGANALIGDDRSNTVRGRPGDDELDGGGGRDRLFGGAGNDLLIFDAQDRSIRGGAGIDTLRFADDGQVYGPGQGPRIAGIEVFDLASTDNLITLTARHITRISVDDTLVVTGDHGNRVDPGPGWQFEGFSDDGRFYEFTKAGAKLLTETSVQVIGFNESTPRMLTAGDDVWSGGPEPGGFLAHYTHGGAGNDQLYSFTSMSQLFGDAGNDSLWSNNQGSVLHGGDGNDTLAADYEAVMYGDAGDDVIRLSGSRVRIAAGGDGADRFIINYSPDLGSNFRILDFSSADGDRIHISIPSFGSLSAQNMTLQPVAGHDDLYALGYVDQHGNPQTLAQLVGTHLQLSTLLPSIDYL